MSLGDIIGGGIGALASWFGGQENRATQEHIANQNIAMQREFAQHGVRWRAADARAAGIHPLFALGAQTHSFAPVSVGSSSGLSDAADDLGKMGQGIGRALEAGMTGDERAKVAAADALTLEKAGLENELLRTQISSLKQKQLGPAMPSGSKSADAVGPAGPLTLLGQGDAKRGVDMPHGVRIEPRKNESPAQKLEDEYGEIADLVGAYRLLKDAGIYVGENLIRPYVVDRRKKFYETGYGRPRRKSWY